MVAIVVGEELTFESIEQKLLDYLGYKENAARPNTIYDLIPTNMAPHHRLWVAKAIRARSLPARLQHPLRSVEVRHASGFYVQMNLKIEFERALDSVVPTFQLVFAPCARQPAMPSTATDVRFVEQVEHQNAVVVLLDIVEFTKACSQLSAVEVGTTHCLRNTLSLH